MRTFFLSLAVLLAAGCGFDDPSTPDVKLWDHFPFDGTRTWEYLNLDTELAWTLVATMRSDAPDKAAGVNIYTLDYTTHCVASDPGCVEGELIRTLQWSSDAIDGVEIHSWAEGSTDVVFDPPLRIADREGHVGDVYETATAGSQWTSEFVDFEPCPVRMTVNDWPDCARFHLDDNDGDDLTGLGLAGDYWAVRTFGVVGIELTAAPEPRWELLKHACEPDKDCDGVW